MAKTAVIGTGLNGLVGSRLVTDFSSFYDFHNLDLQHPTTPTDITDYHQVLHAVSAVDAPVIVHFAAFTDVTRAWAERDDINGIAYRVNVLGTENIARAAAVTDKHLIHISTAYVFDGNKEGMYTETDPVSPIEWYGQTKALAEEKVQTLAKSWTIFRIDQPFRPDMFSRPDILHRIWDGLQAGSLYPQFTNHFFGPTFIPDFAAVIDWAIRTTPAGIFHATAGEQWTDYAFATAVRDAFGGSQTIAEGDLARYLETLQRPYQKNTALDCSKLHAVLDVPQHTIQQALSMCATTR